MSTAVVLGGGVSGLAAAYYLQRFGSKFSKVILLEASGRSGGWVESSRFPDGAVFEKGPRSLRPFGKSGTNTIELAEELGLSDQVLSVKSSEPAARNRFLFVNGQIHTLPNGPGGLFKTLSPFTKPLIWKLMKEPFQLKTTEEDETVYSFIKRKFGSELAELVFDPVCRGIFAGDCRQLSMKSCFPDVSRIDREYGSLFVGMAWSPKTKILSESSLVAQARSEMWSMWSLKQGLQQLTESLEKALAEGGRVEIGMSSKCSQLKFANQKCLVNCDGEEIEADHVFSAIPAKNLAAMLKSDLLPLSSLLNKIPSANVAVVNVEFEENVLQTPGFGHLLPSCEDKSFLGVVYDSCSFPEHNKTGKPSTRFTVLLGGAWYEDLVSRLGEPNSANISTLALTALTKQLGITCEPSRVQVSVQKECIPQYLVGHSSVLDGISSFIASHHLPLSLVGASYRGPSINDCIYNARLEVEKVLNPIH